MAYDEGIATLLRDDLVDIEGITERKMFGGLAFMHFGNMVCGVHSEAAMFRVGKERMDAAMAIDGTRPMAFTGRPMGGMVDAADDTVADDDLRARLLGMALENARSLPPK